MDALRLARNEATFREVNEAIERGRRAREGLVGFLCECAQLGCNRLVDLTIREYEDVRADPVRFVVVDGHETPEIEEVVERHDRYVVVEKRGEGGPVAEETDPRRPPHGP